MWRAWLLLLACLFLSGCSGYLQLIDGLNHRQITSCLYYDGSIRVGGPLSGGAGHFRGITATGGAALEHCVTHETVTP